MRLSWPSPLPTVCSTGRFAVGTGCPAPPPPPSLVVRGGHCRPAHRAAAVLGGAFLGSAASAAGTAAAAATDRDHRHGREPDRYRQRASAPAGSLPSHESPPLKGS